MLSYLSLPAVSHTPSTTSLLPTVIFLQMKVCRFQG